MSSTLLEVTRSSHEEVERLERLIVKELQSEAANNKDRLLQGHRVRSMIDTIISNSNKLVNIYEDKDNARKEEIAFLGGLTYKPAPSSVFAFYDRLKEIREYHRKHPAARVVDVNEQYEALLKEEPVLEFTGEEAYGKYLDMHELHNQYINSKFGSRVDYATYLEEFPSTEAIPRKKKLTKKYKEYLENLLEYLVYFFHRTEPLQDIDRIFLKVFGEFEEQWAIGEIRGWENNNEENGDVPDPSTVIDLDYYSTAEELTHVGPEKLKEALSALGLKTGGTLQQRAERLFLTKHTPIENLDKKHFVKKPHKPHHNEGAVLKEAYNPKEIALMEAKLRKLCDLMEETIVRTRENVVKKQALTYDEMEAERIDEETQAESESDDDEQQIYNPLKLPMGWDGKPIPYWLYKLHGLGQEFKCEICGNYSYWGRRAYERHFKEWRHQHGMRCLGIPNTKNFNEVTSIEEAKDLWKKIQERQGLNKWRPDLEEEYEDREGNIYNKKTYTDLQRQGLI